MKLNKILMSVGAALIFTSTASFAAPADLSPTTGKIQFDGTLVNSACGLAAGQSPLQVSFGEIPISSLKDGKRVPIKEQQEIKLQNCDLTLAQHATITYQPNTVSPTDDSLAAMVSGTAKGAGIGLTDNANRDVKWGQASAQLTLQDGETVVPFYAYLKADSASGTVVPGTFTSQISFKIEYQ